MSTSRRFAALTWRRAVVALVTTALLVAVTPPQAATAAPGLSVDLRVLLISDGSTNTAAMATLLDREGVPYTTVNLNSGTRPTITAAFLADAAAGRGHFQAVITPNQYATGLQPAEVSALFAYERTFGVRQVNAYAFPDANSGQAAPTYNAALDGAAVTVTGAGLSGPFEYLAGAFTIDNFDSATVEVTGQLAQVLSPLPAGATYTPLMTATAGGSTGTIVGVYNHDFREELSITAAFNADQQWFNEIGHGIVTWMTRGIHLGYHRNYLAVHVDDVFLADSRWSSANNCTPGDTPTCSYGFGDNIVRDIRMTAADVTKLVNWQNTNGFKFDMLFNGQGSDERTEPDDPEDPESPPRVDPLTNAFLAAKDQFTWVNHTYSHPFLGCIQIAPTTSAADWHCASTAENTGYYDDSLVPFAEPSGGLKWLGTAKLLEEVQRNQQWAVDHDLPNFDPSALVTGEHSGLLTTPQQTIDNPFLGPVLDTAGIAYTGSDASREPESRQVQGSSTMTLPRHPMNIFYNAGTYRDEVDEYNWIYTAAPGGSGICSANPETSTCMPTALPNATTAQAQASFTSYILPIEVRNAYRYVITGDPRPFYAHQSNLAEDGILYPVVKGILDKYASTHNTAVSPIVTEDLVSLGEIMNRSTAWNAAKSGVTAYVDAAGVHVAGPDGTSVPLTVPAGTTVNGDDLSAYDGELSGWLSASASGALVAVPATPLGGYVGHTAPDAPAPVAATTGTEFYGTIALSWSAPAIDGNSPITGYVVQRSLNTTTPVWGGDLFFPASTTSWLDTGLTENAQYIYRVRADNLVGQGAWSVASAPALAKPIQFTAEASVASPEVTYGSAATITLTVGTTAGHAPTGTATLNINGATYTQAIVGNTATFSVPGLLPGSYPYTVGYGSDLYILPLSLPGSLAVAKAAVTSTGAVLAVPSPVRTGSYAVTVTQPTDLVTPTGSVTVNLTLDGAEPVSRTGALVDGAVTLDLPVLAAGTWNASVVYAGDGNYAALTSAGGPVISTKAAVSVVGAVGTVPSPQSVGTYQMTVTQETGLPAATGTATVTLTKDGSDPIARTGTLSGGTVTVNLPVVPAGTWAASVAYEGDLNYAAATVAGASVVSTKAEVVAAGAVGTAPSPQSTGTYLVTATPPGGLAAPTGDVTVTLTNGVDDDVVVTGELSGGGVTIPLPVLPAGTWTAQVAYEGNDNYAAAAVAGESVVSERADTSVTGAVVTAPSPQDTGAYEVTIAPPSGLAAPTGSVTVTVTKGTDSYVLPGLLSGGTVTVELPSLSAGTWAVAIGYEGDGNYNADTADGESVVSTTASVAVTGSVVTAPSPQHGGAYKVTVTQPVGLDIPTGIVALTLTRGSTTVSATGSLVDGAATVALPSLAVGTWTVSIAYAGDDNYAAPPAAGAPVISPKVAVSGVTGTVTKHATTTTTGTYKVTVTPPSGLAPASGNATVTLKNGSVTKTVTGALSGGVVTVAVPRLTAGTWTASIAYAGDATYTAKSGTGQSVVAAKGGVSKVSTSVTKRPTTKAKGTYKVTVTQPSGLAKATGKVTLTLKKGSVTKKITGSLKSGAVTLSVPKLPNGVWKASVVYAGDATYASKSSAGAYVVVGHTKISKIATSVTKVPTTKAKGTYKVTVSHGTGLPTVGGKVTVTLTKGKTVKKVTGTLKSGVVTVSVPKLPKGTWKVKVSYGGSSVYVKASATGKSVVVTK